MLYWGSRKHFLSGPQELSGNAMVHVCFSRYLAGLRSPKHFFGLLKIAHVSAGPRHMSEKARGPGISPKGHMSHSIVLGAMLSL
eukprot:7071740-Karenia_brevis.AAC.1